MLQRGHSGDGCDLASTLCKYDLRKGELFDLSWTRVRQVRRGSISSELLMCGGGVRSILLLPFKARCLETIDSVWHMFVFMSGNQMMRCLAITLGESDGARDNVTPIMLKQMFSIVILF